MGKAGTIETIWLLLTILHQGFAHLMKVPQIPLPARRRTVSCGNHEIANSLLRRLAIIAHTESAGLPKGKLFEG
jgi:hypothetical protein